MKKLILISLISFFGIQFVKAQALTVCGPEPLVSEFYVNLTVSGGTGPYTWYNKTPCGDITTEAECNGNGDGSCIWLFGQCISNNENATWVTFATGITVPHYVYSQETKVVDALGDELIFTHTYSNPSLNECVSLGMIEGTMFSNVSIFPNPNEGIVNIKLGDLKNIDVKVFNALGQLFYIKENLTETIYQFKLEGVSGIYILELSTQQAKQNYRLILN